MEKIETSKKFNAYFRPKAFEKFIGALFESLGYHVEYKTRAQDRFFDMTIINSNNASETYICEIKYYSRPLSLPSKDVFGIFELSRMLKPGQKGLFITTALCPTSRREQVKAKNIHILDITNLLYLVPPNHELYQSFLELIDFSVSKFEPQAPSIKLLPKIVEQKGKNILINWKDKLKNIRPGKEDFSKYETFCIEILKLLFSDYLSIWKEQQQSNDDLYRFDLICKIKNDVVDDFFNTLNTYFNTRYIVFDFKNYTEEITQKEIYTTEKYLYDKALRKVAIIISRKGINENALKAIKGSIREQGKIIISLSDDDVLQMMQMYNDGNNPTDYLSMKLDDLLIELEK